LCAEQGCPTIQQRNRKFFAIAFFFFHRRIAVASLNGANTGLRIESAKIRDGKFPNYSGDGVVCFRFKLPSDVSSPGTVAPRESHPPWLITEARYNTNTKTQAPD